MPNIETKCREYRELHTQIKALQEEADALKAAMIAEMDSRKLEHLRLL